MRLFEEDLNDGEEFLGAVDEVYKTIRPVNQQPTDAELRQHAIEEIRSHQKGA